LKISRPIFRAACIQLNSGNDLDSNIREIVAQIISAAELGIDFIALPENSLLMPENRHDTFANAFPEDSHPGILALSESAALTGVWLLAGTVAVKKEDGSLANRALLIGPDGKIFARYDKIHMFDVDISGEPPFRESEIFSPGQQAVTGNLPWTKIGLSICYDLRFPSLYSILALSGAEVLAVPSAFTLTTGKAHWHSLLKARAIENACYVIAPAQCGDHPGNRSTFGHSVIISPWGEVLSEAGDEPTCIVAEIDLNLVAETRRKIPVLEHARIINKPS